MPERYLPSHTGRIEPPDGSTPDGTEKLHAVQGGRDVYLTASQVAGLGGGGALSGSASDLAAADGSAVTVGSGLHIAGATISATIAAANPSASVGTSAVNGAASTFMRSDAAPPLDQSIAPTWTGAHVFGKSVALTPSAKGAQSAGGTLTLDFSTGNNFSATFGAGNLTIANPTNVTAGQSGILALTQDSGGSRTVTWGSNWKFSGATAPTLTTTGSASDLIAFIAVSSTVIVATLAVADYR